VQRVYLSVNSHTLWRKEEAERTSSEKKKASGRRKSFLQERFTHERGVKAECTEAFAAAEGRVFGKGKVTFWNLKNAKKKSTGERRKKTRKDGDG